MGLTFLGHGFEPLINEYILGLHPMLLYWINMISAILDNATLAAAEISPAMDQETIRAVLLGLIISGGMLIPGNIPNIIAAGKLNITSKEWARFGVPVGSDYNGSIFYCFVCFLILKRKRISTRQVVPILFILPSYACGQLHFPSSLV